jgi:hypothetical protein
MRDYLRGVANAPLSSAERRRAYAAIGRWVLDGNWKALIFDVRLAGRSVSGRAVQKIRR